MGLEAILKEMERQAARQIGELEGAAAAESQAVIAKAEEKAARIKERELARARDRARREQERLLSAARLDAQRELVTARESWLEQAFAASAERLAPLRAAPRYPADLERLTREAAAELGSEIVLEIDPRDEKLMRRILSALKLRAEVVASLETVGGVCARTPDGGVRVDNTVEARLEKARPELRRKLAALLDAKEVSWQATTVTAMRASGL